MTIKQISIFVQNKQGRLAEIIDILGKNNINICALSIADTTDFGILRVIVDEPDKAEQILKEAGLAVTITSVIAVGIDDNPGGLAKPLHILSAKSVTIEYVYAFVSKSDHKAYVIIKVDDKDKAIEALIANNVPVMKHEELNRWL